MFGIFEFSVHVSGHVSDAKLRGGPLFLDVEEAIAAVFVEETRCRTDLEELRAKHFVLHVASNMQAPRRSAYDRRART